MTDCPERQPFKLLSQHSRRCYTHNGSKFLHRQPDKRMHFIKSHALLLRIILRRITCSPAGECSQVLLQLTRARIARRENPDVDVPVRRHSQQANSVPVMTAFSWPLSRLPCLNARVQATFYTSSTVQRVSVPLHFTWWAVRGHTIAPLYRRHSKYRFFHHVPGHLDQACYTPREGWLVRFCWNDDTSFSFFV
jgi:hypothetical protein